MKNNKLLLVFTHLLTALLAVAITLGAVLIFSTNSPNKLANLQALIDEVFIGEVNKVAIEDAAADAMVNALGDRWSITFPAPSKRTMRILIITSIQALVCRLWSERMEKVLK